MNKALKNYLIFSLIITLLVVIVLLALSPLFPTIISDKSEQSLNEEILKFVIIFLPFLCFPLMLSAYFIFRGFSLANEFEIKKYSSVFITFLGLLFFVILIQSFASTYLVEKIFILDKAKDWRKLQRLIKKEKRVSVLEKSSQQNKEQNKKSYESRLQELNYDFPADLDIAKKLRNWRIKNNLQTKNNLGKKVIDQKSKLENEAIELKNKGDYLAAVEVFQKLIKLYPATKTFQRKRGAYLDQIKICLAKETNRESNLSEEELLNIRINRHLNNIQKDLDENRLFQALAKIMPLRIDHQDPQVTSLHQKIVADWEQNEFHLTPLLYQKKFFPKKNYFEKIKLTANDWTIYCHKIYPYKDFLYLEGVTIINDKVETQRYQYGHLRAHKLFLKNKRYTHSFQIEGDFQSFIEDISFSYYKNDFLLSLMGVPAIFDHLNRNKGNWFYGWLINVKINAWIWTIGLFFLFSAFSWHSRSRLFDFWAILGLLVIASLSLGGYLVMSHRLIYLMNNDMLSNLVTCLISALFTVVSFFYFTFSINR